MRSKPGAVQVMSFQSPRQQASDAPAEKVSIAANCRKAGSASCKGMDVARVPDKVRPVCHVPDLVRDMRSFGKSRELNHDHHISINHQVPCLPVEWRDASPRHPRAAGLLMHEVPARVADRARGGATARGSRSGRASANAFGARQATSQTVRRPEVAYGIAKLARDVGARRGSSAENSGTICAVPPNRGVR